MDPLCSAVSLYVILVACAAFHSLLIAAQHPLLSLTYFCATCACVAAAQLVIQALLSPLRTVAEQPTQAPDPDPDHRA